LFIIQEQIKLMNKATEKKRNSFDTRIVNVIAKKHGYSSRYIKQILTNDRSPIISDQIKKEYKVLGILLDVEISKNIKD